MKQDLRELFKETDLSEKKLPMSHREEFIKKLSQKRHNNEKKLSSAYIANIAASILILCMLSYFLFYQNSNNQNEFTNKTFLETQVEEIENTYLKNIEKEWKNFLIVANDKNLIQRFEQKLEELDSDYQEISIKYKKEPNNILIIEELIDNLSTRLQLLKDIQEHIHILNEANV